MDIEGLVYQKDRQLRVPMPANGILWELCHLVLPKFGAELGSERRTPNRTFGSAFGFGKFPEPNFY